MMGVGEGLYQGVILKAAGVCLGQRITFDQDLYQVQPDARGSVGWSPGQRPQPGQRLRD